MVIVYDQKFNINEWSIILAFIVGIILVWKLPKRFPLKEALVYFTYFIFIGIIFDHTLSIEPFDYYDVNDLSSYQLIDFLSYLSFGAFGYIYIYVYDFFQIKDRYNTIYILSWTLISLVVEYIAQTYLGIYHYKNGYEIYYSFPIYLLMLMPNLYLYRLLNSKNTQHKS